MSTFTQEQLNELQELIKNVVGSNFERRSKKRVHEENSSSNNNNNNNNVNVIEPMKIDSMPLPTHMSFEEFIKKPDDFKEKLFFNDFKKLSDEEIIEYMEHMIRGLYAIGALHSYEAYTAIFIKNLRDTTAYQHSSSKTGKFIFKENHYRMVLSFFGYKFHMRNEEVTQCVAQADVYNSLLQGLITLCNGEHLEFTRPKSNFNVNKPRIQKKKKNADGVDDADDVDADNVEESEDAEVNNNNNADVDAADAMNVDESNIFEEQEEEEEHASKRRRLLADADGELTQPQNQQHPIETLHQYFQATNVPGVTPTVKMPDVITTKSTENDNAVIPEPVKKVVPVVQKKTFTLAAAPYLKSMLPSSSTAANNNTTTTTTNTNASTTLERWEPKTVDRTLSVRIRNGTVLKYSDWKRDYLSNTQRVPGHYDLGQNNPKFQPYVEFQQSNGEWVDLESYYIKFIKNINNENMEGKSFDHICAKYKFFNK